MNSHSSSKLDKAMTPEQFTQVVEAILEGKYSWACVLILRFAGYNPLHYIPYRTYNRLLKENCLMAGDRRSNRSQNCSSQAEVFAAQHNSQQISDLTFLEPIEDNYSKVRGGNAGQIASDRDGLGHYPGAIQHFRHWLSSFSR